MNSSEKYIALILSWRNKLKTDMLTNLASKDSLVKFKPTSHLEIVEYKLRDFDTHFGIEEIINEKTKEK